MNDAELKRRAVAILRSGVAWEQVHAVGLERSTDAGYELRFAIGEKIAGYIGAARAAKARQPSQVAHFKLQSEALRALLMEDAASRRAA